MRICGGMAVLSICLSLTGCSLFGKKASTPSTPNTPASSTTPPFPSSSPREHPPAETVSTSTQINGVLAGQVLDRFNHRPSGVFIQIIDLEDTREPRPAPIEKSADDQGYFTIVGLRPGGHYKLIARVRDGDQFLSGITFAMPPNPRISIWLSEDTTPQATPPVPQQPIYPGKTDNDRHPPAALGPPVKDANPQAITQNPADTRSAGDTPLPNSSAPPATTTPATPPVTSDPTRTADGSAGIKDGFKVLPPKVDIPGGNIPPAPPTIPAPKSTPPIDVSPRSSTISTDPTSLVPTESLPVPSCQLIGNRLVNMALNDMNGNVWEYRKDSAIGKGTGRLLLIDFWHSQCGPCLTAMQHLVELQKQYGPWGLELVGIAYETGTIDQQVLKVRSIRGRYGIRYTTLLGAGGNCPVRTQFDVQAFPTLVLLDDKGKIILYKRGLGEADYYELVHEIRKRLNLP